MDSTFALAYYRLANAFSWGYAWELAKEPIAKALSLIDRIPEKEKFLLHALAAYIEKTYGAGISVAKEMELYYPDDKEMLYYIGDWSYHAYQWPTAVEYFEKVLTLDPTHEQTLYHLATAYARTNQHAKVQSALDRLALVNEVAAYEERGNYHRFLGEYEKAIEYFKKTYEADSTWTSGYHLTALTYRNSGQHMKALEFVKKWLDVNPVPLAYVLVVQAYLHTGDIDSAERTMKLGLQRFPNTRLLVTPGFISGLKGEFDLAEAQLRVTVASDQPADVRRRGFIALARFYRYVGKYSEMTKMFAERIALELNDKDTNSAALYTAEKAYWMYLVWRDRDQVRRELERVVNLQNLTDERYFGYLAAVYNRMGAFEPAKEAAHHVTHQIPKLIIESSALMQKQEWDKALAINTKLIKKFDARKQTLFGYFSAICYYKKGEFDRAIEEVKKATGFYGEEYSYVYPLSFNLLGKIYEKKGDTQLAIQNYEKFLDLWKDADEDLQDLIDAKKRLARLTPLDDREATTGKR